ncbi:hypothetical protein KR222_008948 [Zaprionus bogoriensis]|nr:hypothetical protein KR222_008948 [Zaprionus bogoriensis]
MDDQPFNPFYIGPHPSQACAATETPARECSPDSVKVSEKSAESGKLDNGERAPCEEKPAPEAASAAEGKPATEGKSTPLPEETGTSKPADSPVQAIVATVEITMSPCPTYPCNKGGK